VLVNKVIDKDNLIPLSGSTIRAADELWSNTLQWMDSPTSRVEKDGTVIKGSLEAQGESKVGIPYFAEGKAGAKTSLGRDSTSEVSRSYPSGGLQQVVEEIADSDFVLFIDDFHYIPRSIQAEIGRQIKTAAEAGVRICTASVPHRKDDVVRSNPELRGRVATVDCAYWSEDELKRIANLGFSAMNMDISPKVVQQLSNEAFGSPQLMQAICLNFCFEKGILEALPEQQRIEPDLVTLQNVFEGTSTLTDFSSMIAQLHSGPRQRGVDRKEYQFNDGTKGDVYRCVLLGMRADPPQLAFKYDDMLKRTTEVCLGDSPVGSSVNQALVQMDKIAKVFQEAPLLEWDEDVLDVIEPYFLFFLRCSRYLKTLAS
jgi:hypothetical protein